MRTPSSKAPKKKLKKSTASARAKRTPHAGTAADVPYDRAAILAELEKSPLSLGNTAGGRTPPYNPQYAQIAETMCKRGATTGQLAEVLGVSINTISMWIVTEPEFSKACKIIDEAYDERVKRSLFETAVAANPAAAMSWFDRARKDREEKRLTGDDGTTPLSRLYDEISGRKFEPVEHVPRHLQLEAKVEDNKEPKSSDNN